MAKRPTISDVSQRAGVSVATVDRVLNGRERVREETARRVLNAARDIGYHGAGLIAQRMHADKPLLRMGFVLNKERQDFYRQFASALEEAAVARTDARVELKIAYSPSQGPADMSAAMRRLAPEVDALAASAVAHASIAETVEEIQAAGVPCFALLNDFAQGIRASYVGLNNLKVGRVAASMIDTSLHSPSKIAVFVGGFRWHGHELRETGFRSYFREMAPQHQVLEALVNLETRQLTYEATLDLLDRNPDLGALYVAGGGMEGAIAALREVRTPGAVKLVVHELTPETRSALAERYVTMAIGTPLALVCREVMDLMVRTKDAALAPWPGQTFLQPELFLPESV